MNETTEQLTEINSKRLKDLLKGLKEQDENWIERFNGIQEVLEGTVKVQQIDIEKALEQAEFVRTGHKKKGKEWLPKIFGVSKKEERLGVLSDGVQALVASVLTQILVIGPKFGGSMISSLPDIVQLTKVQQGAAIAGGLATSFGGSKVATSFLATPFATGLYPSLHFGIKYTYPKHMKVKSAEQERQINYIFCEMAERLCEQLRDKDDILRMEQNKMKEYLAKGEPNNAETRLKARKAVQQEITAFVKELKEMHSQRKPNSRMRSPQQAQFVVSVVNTVVPTIVGFIIGHHAALKNLLSIPAMNGSKQAGAITVPLVDIALHIFINLSIKSAVSEHWFENVALGDEHAIKEALKDVVKTSSHVYLDTLRAIAQDAILKHDANLRKAATQLMAIEKARNFQLKEQFEVQYKIQSVEGQINSEHQKLLKRISEKFSKKIQEYQIHSSLDPSDQRYHELCLDLNCIQYNSAALKDFIAKTKERYGVHFDRDFLKKMREYTTKHEYLLDYAVNLCNRAKDNPELVKKERTEVKNFLLQLEKHYSEAKEKTLHAAHKLRMLNEDIYNMHHGRLGEVYADSTLGRCLKSARKMYSRSSGIDSHAMVPTSFGSLFLAGGSNSSKLTEGYTPRIRQQFSLPASASEDLKAALQLLQPLDEYYYNPNHRKFVDWLKNAKFKDCYFKMPVLAFHEDDPQAIEFFNGLKQFDIYLASIPEGQTIPSAFKKMLENYLHKYCAEQVETLNCSDFSVLKQPSIAYEQNWGIQDIKSNGLYTKVVSITHTTGNKLKYAKAKIGEIKSDVVHGSKEIKATVTLPSAKKKTDQQANELSNLVYKNDQNLLECRNYTEKPFNTLAALMSRKNGVEQILSIFSQLFFYTPNAYIHPHILTIPLKVDDKKHLDFKSLKQDKSSFTAFDEVLRFKKDFLDKEGKLFFVVQLGRDQKLTQEAPAYFLLVRMYKSERMGVKALNVNVIDPLAYSIDVMEDKPIVAYFKRHFGKFLKETSIFGYLYPHLGVYIKSKNSSSLTQPVIVSFAREEDSGATVIMQLLHYITAHSSTSWVAQRFATLFPMLKNTREWENIAKDNFNIAHVKTLCAHLFEQDLIYRNFFDLQQRILKQAEDFLAFTRRYIAPLANQENERLKALQQGSQIIYHSKADMFREIIAIVRQKEQIYDQYHLSETIFPLVFSGFVFKKYDPEIQANALFKDTLKKQIEQLKKVGDSFLCVVQVQRKRKLEYALVYLQRRADNKIHFDAVDTSAIFGTENKPPYRESYWFNDWTKKLRNLLKKNIQEMKIPAASCHLNPPICSVPEEVQPNEYNFLALKLLLDHALMPKYLWQKEKTLTDIKNKAYDLKAQWDSSVAARGLANTLTTDIETFKQVTHQFQEAIKKFDSIETSVIAIGLKQVLKTMQDNYLFIEEKFADLTHIQTCYLNSDAAKNVSHVELECVKQQYGFSVLRISFKQLKDRWEDLQEYITPLLMPQQGQRLFASSVPQEEAFIEIPIIRLQPDRHKASSSQDRQSEDSRSLTLSSASSLSFLASSLSQHPSTSTDSRIEWLYGGPKCSKFA